MSSKQPIHLLSLGAGVQSSTLALMASKGEITPMPKAGIFADTQAEPQNVYDWLDYLEKQLAFPVHRVTAGNIEKDNLSLRIRSDCAGCYVHSGVPMFVKNPDGSKGIIPRQCTTDYKIEPIAKAVRIFIADDLPEWRGKHKTALRLLGDWEEAARAARRSQSAPPLRPEEAWNECQADPLVVQWIGISTDEAHRVKDSRVYWQKNRWPLIEMGISRADCLVWLARNGYPRAPKSACYFCPFHNDSEWQAHQTRGTAALSAGCAF